MGQWYERGRLVGNKLIFYLIEFLGNVIYTYGDTRANCVNSDSLRCQLQRHQSGEVIQCSLQCVKHQSVRVIYNQ